MSSYPAFSSASTKCVFYNCFIYMFLSDLKQFSLVILEALVASSNRVV